MSKKEKKNKKETNKLLRNFSLLLWIVSIIFMIVLGYFIYSANVLPLKYFLAIVIVFVVFLSIMVIDCFKHYRFCLHECRSFCNYKN